MTQLLEKLQDTVQHIFCKQNKIDEYVTFDVKDFSLQKDELKIYVRPINRTSLPKGNSEIDDYLRMKRFINYLVENKVDILTEETEHALTYQIALNEFSLVAQELLENKIVSTILSTEIFSNVKHIECVAIGKVTEAVIYLKEYVVTLHL